MADPQELRKLFPRASKSFLESNPYTGLQNPESERVRGTPLDKALQGKAKGYERAHVCFTAFTVRPRDADNLGGGSKALLDAIKHLHLIPDDDPYSIEFEVRQRHVDHFNEEKTLVEITYT